jgi:hypothetical protein
MLRGGDHRPIATGSLTRNDEPQGTIGYSPVSEPPGPPSPVSRRDGGGSPALWPIGSEWRLMAGGCRPLAGRQPTGLRLASERGRSDSSRDQHLPRHRSDRQHGDYVFASA